MTAHTIRGSGCKRGCGVNGYIVTKNGQDCVYCVNCNSYAGYNAPKTETGREVRHVATSRDGMKPAQRARILERDNACCVLCHRNDVNLHVGHLLSVKAGKEQGLSEDQLNDDENLAAMCEDCNLGLGQRPVSIRLLVGVLVARLKNRND